MAGSDALREQSWNHLTQVVMLSSLSLPISPTSSRTESGPHIYVLGFNKDKTILIKPMLVQNL